AITRSYEPRVPRNRRPHGPLLELQLLRDAVADLAQALGAVPLVRPVRQVAFEVALPVLLPARVVLLRDRRVAERHVPRGRLVDEPGAVTRAREEAQAELVVRDVLVGDEARGV